MLGISIYPEKEIEQETINYIDLAAKYGFKRVFTCLLSADKTNFSKIKEKFKRVISHARKNKMEVILDVSPKVFKDLNIASNNLELFYEMGATGIRLDEGFDGLTESLMTYNEYDLDIEINMSSGTKYIDNILSFNPNKKKIIGCHNFYPMEYSGLSLEHFIKTSEQFKKLGIRTAAFVSSKDATHGPWEVMDNGLCTLEMHRNLSITTQVKHYLMMDLIDDIIIANSFASEEELKAISSIKLPTFDVELLTELNGDETKIIFEEQHFNRGDISEYLIRSTQSRIKYKEHKFDKKNVIDKLEKGQVIICNKDFGQYNAELHIIKKEHKNSNQRKNVLVKIIDEEVFLIDYLKPWSKFKFNLIKK